MILEKHQLLQGAVSYGKHGGTLAVSGSSTTCLLRCHAASALLSPVVLYGHERVCRHLLLAPWAGFLKALMPQEHKFKVFASDIAVLQGKVLPAPLYNSCPG